jgi:hypothetical protein
MKSMWYDGGDKKVVKRKKKKRMNFGSKLAQLPFSDNGTRKLVGYFKRKQEKIRKHTDTNVAFTREYSRVLISMRNVKCTRRIRNVQGKDNYRVERVFRIF